MNRLSTTRELTLGSLGITFHQTDRVPDEAQNAYLPPSRGNFPIYRVSEFKHHCPSSWKEGGIFLPVQKTEAMWMSFHSTSPVALTVGAGGINAVTGEKLAARLEKEGYMVAPPQPWLDGWKNTDGTVRQFVCAEYRGGEGVTVGEQLIGQESKTGGIAIAVFEPLKRFLSKVQTPAHVYNGPYSSKAGHWQAGVKIGGLPSLPPFEFCTLDGQLNTVGAKSFYSSSPAGGQSVRSMSEMGVGAGGKITQKIYPDPYGLEVWKTKPSFVSYVYLVSAEDFAEITGQKLRPPAAQAHPGFSMVDGHMADVTGTDKFKHLKAATSDSDVDKAFFPG